MDAKRPPPEPTQSPTPRTPPPVARHTAPSPQCHRSRRPALRGRRCAPPSPAAPARVPPPPPRRSGVPPPPGSTSRPPARRRARRPSTSPRRRLAPGLRRRRAGRTHRPGNRSAAADGASPGPPSDPSFVGRPRRPDAGDRPRRASRSRSMACCPPPKSLGSRRPRSHVARVALSAVARRPRSPRSSSPSRLWLRIQRALTTATDGLPRPLPSGAQRSRDRRGPSDRVRRLRLIRRIGKGGMASVYEAERRGERFALKRPLAGFLDDPRFLERFLREADLGRALHHPNIVRIFDRGQVGRHSLLRDGADRRRDSARPSRTRRPSRSDTRHRRSPLRWRRLWTTPTTRA